MSYKGISSLLTCCLVSRVWACFNQLPCSSGICYPSREKWVKEEHSSQIPELSPWIKLSGFLHLSNRDIWGWIILWLRGHPVNCRIFNSIPGLYTLDAGGTTLLLTRCDNQRFPDIAKRFQAREGGVKLPLVENH